MEDLDPNNPVVHPDATDDSHISDLHDHLATVEGHAEVDGTATDDTSTATDNTHHAAAESADGTTDEGTSPDPHEAADSIWGDVEQSGLASVREAVAEVVHSDEHSIWGDIEQSGLASVRDAVADAVHSVDDEPSAPMDPEHSGLASVHDGAVEAAQSEDAADGHSAPDAVDHSATANAHDAAVEASDAAANTGNLDGHSLSGEVEHTATASVHDATTDAVQDVAPGDGLDAMNHDFQIAPFPGLEQFNGIHGTPVEDMRLWEQQSEPMDCAVATTDMMFRSLGIEVGEVPLEHLFQDAGIYDPAQGTDIHLIADLLNHVTAQAGLNVQAVEIPHFTEQNLEALLDAGVRPLIGLNASEIYDPLDRLLNTLGIIPNAGHAVQLTGIIHNEQGTFAVINDPGVPNGSGTVLPMELFMDAASKMDYDAIALIPT